MKYQLNLHGSVEDRVIRLAAEQLDLAAAALGEREESTSGTTIHQARKRIKKVRGLLCLIRPVLGDVYRLATRRLRNASHMLAPADDAEGVVEALTGLLKQHHEQTTHRALAALRTVLSERAAEINRQTRHDGVLEAVAGTLRSERLRVEQWGWRAERWGLLVGGFDAVQPGFASTVRHMRKATTRALARPNGEHYHVWRRRVKELWFALRLLDGHCAHALAPDVQRLEALDGYLGAYHNITLLQEFLQTHVVLSREDTARCLRVLRAYRSELAREARQLGTEQLAEKPRHFVKRVRRLWHAADQRPTDVKHVKPPVPHAA